MVVPRCGLRVAQRSGPRGHPGGHLAEREHRVSLILGCWDYVARLLKLVCRTSGQQVLLGVLSFLPTILDKVDLAFGTSYYPTKMQLYLTKIVFRFTPVLSFLPHLAPCVPVRRARARAGCDALARARDCAAASRQLESEPTYSCTLLPPQPPAPAVGRPRHGRCLGRACVGPHPGLPQQPGPEPAHRGASASQSSG